MEVGIVIFIVVETAILVEEDFVDYVIVGSAPLVIVVEKVVLVVKDKVLLVEFDFALVAID